LYAAIAPVTLTVVNAGRPRQLDSGAGLKVLRTRGESQSAAWSCTSYASKPLNERGTRDGRRRFAVVGDVAESEARRLAEARRWRRGKANFSVIEKSGEADSRQ
jgi:hypothetical protein